MALLEVQDLRTGYGALPVLHGISFSIEEGEFGVMLGLNGAGKTTTMMALTGMLKTWSGDIVFNGESIASLDPADRVVKGVALSPEGRRVFPQLSVEINLRLGAWVRRKDSAGYKRSLDLAFELFPRLHERRTQLAGTMSGGEQQMLAVARALMAQPKLLLIDEASLGLAPKTAQEMFGAIQQISKTGITVIMVEHNAGALKLADRAWIMQKGTLVFSGAGDEELRATDLRAAYLG
ncbi:MAG TPA: ABC transporter ATP-binding protein [Actinomycetota bacterium]|nr:ABC transporter ATP-binding protein [Actinomycetota bacterium]